MKAVFDTNILIDYLNGEDKARKEISRYRTKIISIITTIEVLVGVTDEKEEIIVKSFLSTFEPRALTAEIAEEAIRVRKEHRMKVPDAIVYATARMENCLIVTRNSKDLKPVWADVRIPYRI